MKPRWIIVIFALAGTGLLCVLAGQRKAAAPAGPASVSVDLPVQVVSVARRRLATSLTRTGVIQASNDVVVISETVGRVLAVSGDTIHRPGPRVVEGVEQLTRAIHPEIFPRLGAR